MYDTPNQISGRKVVTTAGTEVALATTHIAKKVEISALESNTDMVVIGDSSIVAGTTLDGAGTRKGTPLAAGQTHTLEGISDISHVYLDAVVSGEGVSFTYYY